MTDEDGKEPYPDDVEETEGWPDSDEEVPYDQSSDPDRWKEPYPDDIESNGEERTP